MLAFMKRVNHILLVALLSPPLQAWCAPPLADVHAHFKWNQEEITSAQQAGEILIGNDVVLAVVIGTPADYALRLARVLPDRVVPLWSPYRRPRDWSTWAYDRDVLIRARQALESGSYRGIGELHLIGDFAPHWRSAVIGGLARMAAEFNVPVLVHTEFSQPDYMNGLCRAHPETRFLWAHAGALLTPQQVSGVMTDCANVWAEFSARDPWRFINNPIADQNHVLLQGWQELIAAFPGRFMVGSDPVWPVEILDSWDEPDSGWQNYSRFIAFHRRWLNTLPSELAERVRLTNALEFFKN